MKLRAIVFALLLFAASAVAQEKKTYYGVPADVFYLMPDFGQGTVYLRGQRPGRGRVNICAVDNTLRMLDDDGTELTVTQDEDILQVRIDSVMFLHFQKEYYRLYPLSGEMGVAVRREVRILSDTKEGAYGTTSQTTSVQEYGVIRGEGMIHNLQSDKEYPYTSSDIFSIYREGQVCPLTRKALRKLFPARKDEIDAFFKSGAELPETVPEALDFLARWAD